MDINIKSSKLTEVHKQSQVTIITQLLTEIIPLSLFQKFNLPSENISNNLAQLTNSTISCIADIHCEFDEKIELGVST